MKTTYSIASEMRKDIISMCAKAKSGHPGGSLSVTDILATLYSVIRHSPDFKKSEERDQVVLSKGHAAPALYASLATYGYFDKKEYEHFRKHGGILQGHPDMNKTPGVDASSGSLGQGITTSIGMALGNRVKNSKGNIYAILGDGELNEGVVWEAFMSAAHYKLDNLIVIIDNNGLQIDGENKEIMDTGCIEEKLAAFGFKTIGVDGHDHEALLCAYNTKHPGKPLAIIAKTVKGKGVSFMENIVSWHGSPINEEIEERALLELKKESEHVE